MPSGSAYNQQQQQNRDLINNTPSTNTPAFNGGTNIDRGSSTPTSGSKGTATVFAQPPSIPTGDITNPSGGSFGGRFGETQTGSQSEKYAQDQRDQENQNRLDKLNEFENQLKDQGVKEGSNEYNSKVDSYVQGNYGFAGYAEKYGRGKPNKKGGVDYSVGVSEDVGFNDYFGNQKGKNYSVGINEPVSFSDKTEASKPDVSSNSGFFP